MHFEFVEVYVQYAEIPTGLYSSWLASESYRINISTHNYYIYSILPWSFLVQLLGTGLVTKKKLAYCLFVLILGILLKL